MEYITLGRTGTKVPRICLGCMTFSEPDRGSHSWTLPAQESLSIIRRALAAGINLFDTATKVFNRMKPGPNGGGLSRKAIQHEIDPSLQRLGTDYVDLYQVHRWDPGTPIEETLEALHDVVKAGKARYIGVSSMFAWQFAKALHAAERHHLTRFVTMQNHLNLLYREEEREMLPLCRDEGIGVLPWSPLARGRLARPWGQATARTETDDFGHALYDSTEQADCAGIQRVAQVAAQRGVAMAQAALAWVAQHPAVTAPIVGASRPQHVDDAVAALQVRLAPEEMVLLEAPYVPHAIAGQ